MGYSLQCLKFANPVIPKGAYASKTYANKRDNRKPSAVEIYKPNASGALELVVRVSIK
jgi:cobalamin-dependent methionine synthase I